MSAEALGSVGQKAGAAEAALDKPPLENGKSRTPPVAGALSRLPPSAQLAAILLVALFALSVFYLAVALNIPYNADHAIVVLMGESVARGNLLLKGWTLGTQPYYTTELPFYAAGVRMLGVTWRVIYFLTGLHWGAIALLVIYLCVTQIGGGSTLSKVFISFSLTLYLAALLLSSEYLSNAHLVGFAYCLICLLGIRGIERTGRWPHYAVYAVFLILAMVGDIFGIYLMAIPVVIVCLGRIVLSGPQRPAVPLLIITVAAVALSRGVLSLLALYGGAVVPGPPTSPVDLPSLGHNLYVFGVRLLRLFAAPLPDRLVLSTASAISIIHLSGLILFSFALFYTGIRILRQTLYLQVVAVIVVINLVENILLKGVQVEQTRYLAPALIFGIILVCQVVFESSVFRNQPRLVLLYFAILFLSLVPPLSFSKPVSPGDSLAKLLVRLHLTNGYGPSWRSSNTTVAAAGQAAVRPVFLYNGESIRPVHSLSDESWFHNYADFLVIDAQDQSGLQPTRAQAIRIFGAPISEYELPGYGELLVWDHDITPMLGRP